MTTSIPQFIADALARVHPEQPDFLPAIQQFADRMSPLQFILTYAHNNDRRSFIENFLGPAYAHPQYTFFDATGWTLDHALAAFPPDTARPGSRNGKDLAAYIYVRELDTNHQIFLPFQALLKIQPAPDYLAALPSGRTSRHTTADARPFVYYLLDSATYDALCAFLKTPPTERTLPFSTATADQLGAQLFDIVINGALQLRASDIHLWPKEEFNRVDVILRVNGAALHYRPKTLYGLEYHDALIRHLQTLAQLPPGGQDRIQQGMFTDRTIHYRLQLLPGGTTSRTQAVLRKNDPSSVIRPLGSIFLHPTALGDIKRLIETAPAGFVLVTGVTGSGKTTTLYSMLYAAIEAYSREKIVRSIEDPIEVPVDWMMQTAVTPTESAPAIFKALLRSDPDWIFVGEIRDTDMLVPATHAALSGHLTFSSFHSAGVFETLTRLHEMGASYQDLARIVRLIVSQSLFKTLCPACRIPHADGTCLAGRGCPDCRHTGYAGRLALMEYIMLDPAASHIQAAIASNDKKALDDIISAEFLSKRAYADWAVQRGLLARNDPQLLLVS